MGSQFFIKQGDQLPAIQSTLLDANGLPINLSGASVVFLMRKLGAPTPKVEASASIVDALNGIVAYAWQPGDTDTPDSYGGEWVATVGGLQMTVPNFNYVTIIISPNLQGGTPAPPPPPFPPLPFAAQVLQVTNPQASDGVSINATGIAANQASPVMGGVFLSPDVPRGVRIPFPIGWDGGGITVGGTDQFGAVISELLAPNPGGFTDSNHVYATVTSASKALVGATSGVATVGFGMRLGIIAKLANAAVIVLADNAPEGAIIDTVNNSFVPTTQPNGTVSYGLTVNT